MTIISHDVIAPRVRELYETGGFKRGSATGWPSVDALYSVGLGQWTLVTGTPNSGKSEFVDAMMVNLARREEWKFAIYSPEHWPLELHFAHIIEKYTGKPFNPGPTPRLDVEELDAGLAWMRGKFIFCKPDNPSMYAILEEANNLQSFGAWKVGVVIDPWNQLEHMRDQYETETEYVSRTLTMVINWVREMNCHLWLIAHPSKLMKTKEGKLPVPTPHDVSGSAHFWNKADNCLCVWRDQVEGTQDVDIHVQKIRFRHIGRIGLATLKYDRVTGLYHEKLQAVSTARAPYAD